MLGVWSIAEVDGKRVDVYTPPGKASPGAVLFLHGHSQVTLRNNAVFAGLFDRFGLLGLCPHGKRSWWTDRICPEFDLQLSAENWLSKRFLPACTETWKVPQKQIALLGIGMGGQGALRLAFRHPQLFQVVAGIASTVDFQEMHGGDIPLSDMYDSREQCRQDTATLHLHPTHYPAHIFFCIDPDDDLRYRGNDRLHEKLSALGIPHEYDFTTQGGGHSWNYFNRQAERAVAFVAAGLQQQARRLL